MIQNKRAEWMFDEGQGQGHGQVSMPRGRSRRRARVACSCPRELPNAGLLSVSLPLSLAAPLAPCRHFLSPKGKGLRGALVDLAEAFFEAAARARSSTASKIFSIVSLDSVGAALVRAA